MRRATMVCADFPDIRVGRITHAMRLEGWEHDAVTRGFPPQFEDAYASIDWHPFRVDFTDALAKTDSELFHVHAELHHFFPVMECKEIGDRPVIVNVHDLTCARAGSILDRYEAEAIEAADAIVWVTDEQRIFADEMGLDVDKPYCIVPNHVSSRHFIDKSVLPHVGGVVYEGGIDPRGQDGNDRDFSSVADLLGDAFHIYPGGSRPDYGNVHDTELEYAMLIHRLSQHDWGLAGFPEKRESWMQADVTKAYEYMAAGIPVIAMNTPKLMPLVEEGMAVWCESLDDLTRLPDPKPYVKRVMEGRRRYTIERSVGRLAKFYDEVLQGVA